MMPYLQETRSRREIVDTFGGVNKSKLIREGEWSETQNISLDNYPVFSVRKKEGLYLETNMDAAVAKGDKLFYITGANQTTAGKLYEYDGEIDPVEIQGIALDAVNGHKLVSFGAYLIILPEKIWINTAKNVTETIPESDPEETYETYEHGEVEASLEWFYDPEEATDNYSYSEFYNSNGEVIGIVEGETSPDTPNVNDLWYKRSEKALYIYSSVPVNEGESTAYKWKPYDEQISTYFFYQTGEGVTENYDGKFGKGDIVKIVSDNNDDDPESFEEQDDGYYEVISNDIYGYGITVKGYFNPLDKHIVISRMMPQMDFIFENNNRLWGCRYGLNNDGEFVNEIYASKLGDFKNWTKYAGISTDSYAASIGTDGPFTGAYNYLGYPTFFKENYIHKVYGAYPAQYQIQTTSCPGTGVMKGCDRSLAVCDHILYYKARNCICAYDGNYPVSVSAALGDEQFKLIDAVGGSCRGSYYISMSNAYHNNITYVYYASLRKWVKAFEHPIREPRIEFFVPFRDDLLYGGPYRNCYCVYNTKNTVSGTISWSATSGLWQITSPDKKYVSKLLIRMKLPASSTFKAEIEYDSSEPWETKANITANASRSGLASFNLPILPRRCDHLRLRLSGTGDCEIYSITKTIENGSDI